MKKMSTIRIRPSKKKAPQCTVQFVANNNRIVMATELYTTHAGALRAVHTVLAMMDGSITLDDRVAKTRNVVRGVSR